MIQKIRRYAFGNILTIRNVRKHVKNDFHPKQAKLLFTKFSFLLQRISNFRMFERLISKGEF